MREKLYKPIILKSDSSQDELLLSMRRNPNANQEELKMLEKGAAGEKEVLYHLEKSNIGLYALRDINISINNKKAQIDFILITDHHCYFVECKNYNADIVNVDEMGNFSLSRRYGKRYNRIGIGSPITQAEEQFSVFKDLCFKHQEEISYLLFGLNFNDYFKTLAVFTDTKNMINVKKAPRDLKYRVLKIDNLIRQIEYDNNHYRGNRLSQEEMKNIAQFFLKYNINPPVTSGLNTKPYYPTDYKKTNVIVNNYYNSKDNRKREIKKVELTVISKTIAGIIGFAAFILMMSLFSSKTPNVRNGMRQNMTLTNEQIDALNILKKSVNESETEGFSIIHTNTCNEISSIFNNKISCTKFPLYVSYKDVRNLSIKHNYTCYSLQIDDNNKIINKKEKYIGYGTNECPEGVPVGFLDWDDSNEYYQKIGGIDKIKSMAIDSYKNNTMLNSNFFNYSHVEERGGVYLSWSTYKMDVDMFFAGLTGRGYSISSETTKNEFEEMVKNYYYIMK